MRGAGVGLGFEHDLTGETAGFADGAFLLETVGVGGLRQGEDAVDFGAELAGGEPAVEVEGGGTLFVGGSGEHDEAAERAAFDVEGADGERGAGFATGHEDEAAAGGEGGGG